MQSGGQGVACAGWSAAAVSAVAALHRVWAAQSLPGGDLPVGYRAPSARKAPPLHVAPYFNRHLWSRLCWSQTSGSRGHSLLIDLVFVDFVMVVQIDIVDISFNDNDSS